MVDVMTMKNHWNDDEVVKMKRKSKRVLFDSDEESESVDNAPQSLSSTNDEMRHNNGEVDSDDDHLNKTDFTKLNTPDLQKSSITETASSIQKVQTLFQNKDLYDAESSDEDDNDNKEGDSKYLTDYPNAGSSNNSVEKETFTNTSSIDDEQLSTEKRKKPTKQTRQPASRKAKTAAINEIDNIHSETQRLLRESRLSLPYHRPKQHSIKEFLQRRKPIVPAVKEISEASKNLGLIWKDLEEREKEAEVFYKSESEDSDNDTNNKEHDEQPKMSAVSNTGDSVCDKEVSICEQNANTDASASMPVTQTGQIDEESGGHSDINCSVQQNILECNQMDTSTEETSTKVDTGNMQSQECMSEHSDMRSVDKDICTVSSFNPSITSDDKCIQNSAEGNEVTRKPVTCGVICDDNARDSTVDDNTANFSENVSMLDVFNLGSQDLVLHYTVSDTADLYQDKDVISDTLRPTMNSNASEAHIKTETKPSETEILRNSSSIVESVTEVPKTNGEGTLTNSTQESDPKVSVTEDTINKTVSNNCAKPNENAKELESQRTSEIERNCLTSDTKLHKQDTDAFKNSKNVGEGKTSIMSSIQSCNDVADNLGSKDALHKSKTAKLQSRINTFFKPQLKGDPDEIIDLDACVSKTPSGVNALIERFMKHSAGKKKSVDKHNLEVSVSSLEKGENGDENIVKEVLTIPLDEEAPEDPELAKPGAKLLRLKEELIQKMARQREEEWLKKQQEFKIDNEEDIDDEKSECGLFDADTEEPVTESESEEEEEEEEEEENRKVVRKKTVKNKFLDDEAEVSGDDDYEEEEDDDGDSDSDADQDGDVVDGNDNIEDSELIKKNNTTEPDKSEVASENAEADGNLQKEKKLTRLKRIMTHDMFDSQGSSSEDEGDYANTSTVSNLTIPPYQPGGAQSQISQLTQEKVNAPSPTLEVILSKESGSQQVLEGSDITACAGSSIFGITNVAPSQEGCKKLFLPGTFDTQKNMDELMEFCSGDFPATGCPNLENLNELKQPDIDKDLLELCSGKFPTQPVSMTSLEKEEESKNDAVAFDDTQSIENTQELRSTLSSDKGFAIKNVLSSEQSQRDGFSVKAKQASIRIVSSDEEDSVSDDDNAIKRKKKNKKLDFSDDDDDGAEEEENALSDRETDNEDLGDTDNPEDVVDYDSEENEVAEKPKPVPKTLVAKEFFENEAELSESEWGSEDEDERDLDNLEWEEGDDENVDQKKLKEQLGKIHMRQVLDDDQRNVRLLQELLLEDGELHSEGGRERKFRWKNMNIMDENEPSKKDSDGEDAIEFEGNEEDEAEWRKERFERETFLMEQKEKAAAAGKDDIEFIEDDSQLLKLGKAALERMRRSLSHDMSESQSIPRRCSDNLQVSPNPKQPFQLLTKRGSFLARSESSLARIAQLTDGTSITSTVITTKNSRNFVFATLSPEKVEQKEEVTATQKIQKRKSNGATPFLVKKLKMSEGNNRNTSKCLFDHLEQ